MRNKYAGKCYRCGLTVEKGKGHFERFQGGWRTQHAECAIRFRGTSLQAEPELGVGDCAIVDKEDEALVRAMFGNN